MSTWQFGILSNLRLEADCCLLCSSLSEDFFKVLVVFDGSTLANLLCYLGPYAFEEHQVVACVQVVNELLELGSLLYDLRSRLGRRLLNDFLTRRRILILPLEQLEPIWHHSLSQQLSSLLEDFVALQLFACFLLS